MRKKTSPFLFSALFYGAIAITLLGVLYLFSVIFIQPGTSSTIKATLSKPGLSPKLSPEYVALLKQQADEKKTFFKDLSAEVIDLKKKHKDQRAELLNRHREERKKFLDEKHDAAERKAFFNKQRDEMVVLKGVQKKELSETSKAVAEKRSDFLYRHKQERLEQIAKESPVKK